MPKPRVHDKYGAGGVSVQNMLLKTKYWLYFLRLCDRTGLDISTLRNLISSLEVGGVKNIGDLSFRLVSKRIEKFGAVYRVDVYEREKLVLKSPVLLYPPLKEGRKPVVRGLKRS